MGMLYEYEGLENLFHTGTLVKINVEYIGKTESGNHEVRIRWYPKAIDNEGQIKVASSKQLTSCAMTKGCSARLEVEYIAYHREGYHIICLDGPESGKDDMLVHSSLFLDKYITKKVAMLELMHKAA